MRNILITGSFCSLNNGDLAMIYGFRQMMDGNELFNYTVLSMYPFTEQGRYKANVIGVPTTPRFKFGFNLIANNIQAIIYKITGGRFKKIYWGKEFRAYSKADLIVDLSGDGYSDEITPLGSIIHSLQLLPGIILGKKIYICAQSLGPFNTFFTRSLAKFVFNKVSLLTVRESLSEKYLQSMELKRSISITGDCAFGMSPNINEQVKPWHISFAKWKSQGKIIIGVSLSKRLSRFLFPEIEDMTQKYNIYIETMAHIIDQLINRYDCKIVFIPHVLGPALVDDRYTHRDIAEHIKKSEDVIILEDPFVTNEMKAIISKVDYMISARMHALIAAYSTGVPGVAVGYSHKYAGIIGEMLGLNSVFIDIRSLEDTLDNVIMEKVNYLINNSEQIKKQLSEVIPSIKERSKMNCQLAIELLRD